MSIIPWLEKNVHGDGNIAKDIKKYGTFGQESYDAGRKLTEEGLGGLRSDLKLFDDRLRDPLGEEGNSIFRRASGQISDAAVRRNRSFSARLAERARQSGGTLSPAAIAELEQETQRDVAEEQFKSEFELASEKAALTLSETNRLFDRRSDIRKTMLGVADADKARGSAAWLASLGLRLDRHKAIAQTISSMTGGLTGTGGGFGSGSPSGSGNPWGGG